MSFAFSGFAQEGEYRVYSYELLPRDAARSKFRVRVDLALARSYHIAVQELPVLCRTLLEARGDDNPAAVATYSAVEMSAYATARTAAEETRKARRPFPPRRHAEAESEAGE